MELINQFQGFIGSIGFGFFFFMIFHPIYKMVKNATFFIKIPSFLITFMLSAYLYFLFLVKYTFGIMSIFYPLSIFIGICFYYCFYFESFNCLYDKTLLKIQKVIKLKIEKRFDIIINKIGRKKKYVKTSESKKQND